MIFIIGLGNPGFQYTMTRHNTGFFFIELIAQKYFFSKIENRGKCLIQKGLVMNNKVVILKPMMCMNQSGLAVAEVIAFYKGFLDKIIVVHDDLGIELGMIKIKFGGGSGGHKGLKSLDQHIGKEYWRLRVGIGHPGEKVLVSQYVLKKLDEKTKTIFHEILSILVDEIPVLLQEDRIKFLENVNLKLLTIKKNVKNFPT